LGEHWKNQEKKNPFSKVAIAKRYCKAQIAFLKQKKLG
jgi:hypothetical protein